MKLQIKILLPIIILMVMLLTASSIINYNLSSSSLTTAIVENMADEANNMSRTISRTLTDSVQDMVRTAGNDAVLDFFKGDILSRDHAKGMTPTLTRLMKSYSQFDRISLLDTKGVVVASSDESTIGTNFSSRQYFQVSIKGNTCLTEPYMSSVTKTGVMATSAPIFADGAIIGVVYGIITLEDVYKTAVQNVQIGEKGYGYVVNKEGQIVIIDPSHKDWLFNPSLPSTEAYKALVKEADGIASIMGNDGRLVEIYHTFDKESGLMSMVRAEPDDVFASLNSMRSIAVWVVVASIILGSLLVYILLLPIVRALNKGVIFATDIAEGRLDSQLDVHRNDEIGKLANALRTIPESLNSIIAEYGVLEKRVECGELTAQGDAGKFSGDFAKLIQGTNGILTRFCTIIDSIPSPVVILNKDLVAPYVNIVGRKVAGEEFKGKTCKELFAREDFWTENCALKKAVETKQPATAETIAHPPASGKNLDISYTAIPMLDDKGAIAAVMQLITDLSAIKSTQRTIVEVAGQATEISNRVAAASEELSAQVDQVSSGTEVQRDRAASTAAAMEEMNSTVLEVARNAGQAREQAEETKSKATEGAEMVRQVIQAIDQVNTVAQELDANMQELGAQAENIGSVMNVISDIADQTNLLALNAAIEAARAGEAGRGFAVVADSVRQLAEKTMQATVEVGSSIKGVQSSTTKNIERVGEAARGVEKSTELASTSGEALAEILNLATGNAELIASIATAAEEQSATSEEINRSVDEINRIANETATGMNDSAQAVSELASMAQELKLLLDKLQS